MDLEDGLSIMLKVAVLCDIQDLLFSYCVFSTGFIFEVIPENYYLEWHASVHEDYASSEVQVVSYTGRWI